MPLIDWTGAVPVVYPGFKYYWAVAVPLTAVVLLSWAVLTHKQYWKVMSRIPSKRRSSHYDIEKASMGHND